MPLYAYRCPKGHRFDARKSVEERDSAACPRCSRSGQRQRATFAVNWNGLPPSRGGIAPLVSDFADERNRRARMEASRKRHGERG